MSRRRNYSPETIAIMERFYDAFDFCNANKIIKTITGFCDDNGIDKRHFYAQRKDLGRGFFEMSWMLPLVNNYGVSAHWLLTGKGAMFDPKAVTVTVKPQSLDKVD